MLPIIHENKKNSRHDMRKGKCRTDGVSLRDGWEWENGWNGEGLGWWTLSGERVRKNVGTGVSTKVDTSSVYPQKKAVK